jgi:predicted amidophosphoribosyltransferase
MHLPPPINLKPKRTCPGCRLWTPLDRRDCVHCGGTVSEEEIAVQRERHARWRRRAMLKAAIVLPLLLVLLTLLFQFLET